MRHSVHVVSLYYITNRILHVRVRTRRSLTGNAGTADLAPRHRDRRSRLGSQKPMSPVKTKCFPFKRIKIAFRKWYRIRHVRGRKHPRPPRRKQSDHKKRRTRRDDPRRILCLLSGESPPFIIAEDLL